MIGLILNLSLLFLHAEVVKLANTLRSGRSERKLLRVQLPSSAILEDQRTSTKSTKFYSVVPSPRGLSPSGTLQSFVAQLLTLDASLSAPPTVKDLSDRELVVRELEKQKKEDKFEI